MSTVVIDDHLLRDVLTGDRPHDLDGLATGLATTGLWLFRLTSSFAAPGTVGKLSAPVKALPTSIQEQSLPPEIEILHLRDLAWSMAGLQHRHRQLGHQLSAAMVEVLAAAHALGADIAVSERDVGPDLRPASLHDIISFHTL